jgi:5'-methylthioinosine phosphorylase
MNKKMAVLGGSALPRLENFEILAIHNEDTPFGATSAPIFRGIFAGHEIFFLDRHGSDRKTAPHKINYRANIWALHQLGVGKIIGLSNVGGIRSDMTPGYFAFPDQLLDYTNNRANSFYEEDFDFSRHIDFSKPFSAELHHQLVEAAQSLGLNFTEAATYGVTQGPRFETIAEINRMERDGCDIVGMTAMPESALARELEIQYAIIAIVASKAAGRSDGLNVDISDIHAVVQQSLGQVYELLRSVISTLS